MKVAQTFTVARPFEAVWTSFKDVPEVATCMPGAVLTDDRGDGVYAGRVAFRLGPFSASFEGEAKIVFDDAAHAGHVEGKGVDKRGGSRSRMTVDFAVTALEAATTQVVVDADIVLSGAIAQFGRTNLVQETAKILIGDFVKALEAKLAVEASGAQPAAQQAPPPSGLSLIWRVIKGLFHRAA